MRATSFDAVVVGSGATGGVAAKTLAEAGCRVLVLEAGPALEALPTGRLARTVRQVRHLLECLKATRQRVQSRHPTYWTTNPALFVDDVENPYDAPEDAPFRWIRCRVVGGRTHAWDGVTPRMSDHEFFAAERDGIGPSWPFGHDELDPHYARLERYFGIHGRRDGLPQLPDGAFVGAGRLTAAERVLAERAAIDFPERPVLLSRGFRAGRDGSVLGASLPLANVTTTLGDALRTGNTTLRTNAVARRVVMHPDGRRARGVEYVDATRGTTHLVEARLVFLCASTIESVRLLLNSACPASGHPHGLGADSGVLGRFLMDHVAGNLFFQLPDVRPSVSPSPLRGADSFLVPRYQNLNGASEAYARGFGLWGAVDRTWFPPFVRRFPGECFGFISYRGEVLPDRENRVELDPERRDPWGVPIVRIHLRRGENDLALADAARRDARRLVEAAGGEVADVDRWFAPSPVSDHFGTLMREWQCSTPGLVVHEFGGARMGTSPRDSVVDPDCALWGVPNLFVTDGACWPSAGWQNPTLTMMAVTDRAVRRALAS